MWQRMFSGASLLDLPLIVMFAFLALFVGVLVWTHVKRGTQHYARMSSLPLDLANESSAQPSSLKEPHHD